MVTKITSQGPGVVAWAIEVVLTLISWTFGQSKLRVVQWESWDVEESFWVVSYQVLHVSNVVCSAVPCGWHTPQWTTCSNTLPRLDHSLMCCMMLTCRPGPEVLALFSHTVNCNWAGDWDERVPEATLCQQDHWRALQHCHQQKDCTLWVCLQERHWRHQVVTLVTVRQ